jgi:hypothetical protein
MNMPIPLKEPLSIPDIIRIQMWIEKRVKNLKELKSMLKEFSKHGIPYDKEIEDYLAKPRTSI